MAPLLCHSRQKPSSHFPPCPIPLCLSLKNASSTPPFSPFLWLSSLQKFSLASVSSHLDHCHDLLPLSHLPAQSDPAYIWHHSPPSSVTHSVWLLCVLVTQKASSGLLQGCPFMVVSSCDSGPTPDVPHRCQEAIPSPLSQQPLSHRPPLFPSLYFHHLDFSSS